MANTLAAVRAGCTQVQGTVNGYGERVGNVDLLTVIADLEIKMGHETVGPENLKQLTSVAQYVAETCNLALPAHHPYTGASAFAHKGGLHASAIARFPEAYEHARPSLVGNDTRMLVSELAGKASLIAKARNLGFDLNEHPELVQTILDDIKEREAAGFSYETADGSLAMLLCSYVRPFKPHSRSRASASSWTTKRTWVPARRTPHQRRRSKSMWATAASCEPAGDGLSVRSARSTRRCAWPITESYPEVSGMELVDYKVRILDTNVGTGATTRVMITTRDRFGTFGTIGVSENIIEASWNALVDSIEYGLMRMGK